MRGSTASAAASARFAMSIRSSVGSSAVSSEKSCRSPVERAQFFGVGQARMRIFGGQRGQIDGRPHHLLNALGREVGRVGRAHALADEHPQSRAARAGFFQRFQFAHAHVGGKFVAFRDGAFGIGGAGGKRLFDCVLGDFRQASEAAANVKRFPRRSCGRCEQSGCRRPPARSGLLCRTRPRLRRA